MDLAAYLAQLAEEGTTAADFAKRVGVSKASISRIARREQNTDLDTVQKIIDASGGAVTADSFFAVPAQSEGEAA